MSLHYLETGSTDPAWNLAFEEVVLETRKSDPYLILWQNDNTIVVGQNQNTEEEINRKFVDIHNIHVVRRMTGGGAVYHDMGNLNYSFIDDAGPTESLNFDRFTNVIIDVLKGLGLDAVSSGRNDILINGYKISGTAQRVVDGRILYHGTLLFDSDSKMIEGALNVDPLKYKSKSKKSVKSRVGNIRAFLDSDIDIYAFKSYLISNFSKGGLIADKLNTEELNQVSILKHNKYDTWNWTYGKSPKFTVEAKQKWNGGIVDIKAYITNGMIHDIKFYGDFLSLIPLVRLEHSLIGKRFSRNDVQKSIDSFLQSTETTFREYFGLVTEKEVLDTLFNNDVS